MDESTLRNLLGSALADEPPIGPVAGSALRAGVRLRRRRRALLVTIPVLAAAVVTVVAVAVAGARPGGRPAPAKPAAAQQFNPLIPYAVFGWLPAGRKLLEGGTTRGATYQVAGPPSLSRRPWYLLAYPAGGCQLTKARGLTCKAYYPFGPLALTGRAPDIRGHRAFWATAYAAPWPWRALAWQYAPGSWAVLELGKTTPPGRHGRQVAVKAAGHARFGGHAAPPVAFPIQLTGLPASWRLISGVRAWMPEWNGVTYRPDGHVLYASHWSVSTGATSTGPHARPFLTFTVGLAGQPGSCPGRCAGPSRS